MGKPWEILKGDVRHVLPTLERNYFDAVLTDPPYGISFMGHKWDQDVPSVNVWTSVLRVMKPGAYAIVFGGENTFARVFVNLLDAHFEPRHVMFWFNGMAMPKSVNVQTALSEGGASQEEIDRWKGYGTGLKPAYEPALLARKPFSGTLAHNIMKYGCGALNIDACRIKHANAADFAAHKKNVDGAKAKGGKGVGWANYGFDLSKMNDANPAGRWPATIALDEANAEDLDAHAGSSEVGGASRYFFTSKASRREKDRGCEELPSSAEHPRFNSWGVEGHDKKIKEGVHVRKAIKNTHTTVKPLDLMRHWALMILPPPRADGTPRRLLVPYSGSGSEIIAALQVGWEEVVGIEREAKYIQIANARIAKGRIFTNLP